jgi:hypothetical protein
LGQQEGTGFGGTNLPALIFDDSNGAGEERKSVGKAALIEADDA